MYTIWCHRQMHISSSSTTLILEASEFFKNARKVFVAMEVLHVSTEPQKGHFFSNIYQKRNRNKKIRKEIKTIISRLNDFLSFLSNI